MNNVSEGLAYLQAIALVVNAILVLVIWPLRNSIDALKKSDDRLHDRIQSLEVKVAENYIQRGEVSTSLTSIVNKLDRIEARLEGKIEALEHQKADK